MANKKNLIKILQKQLNYLTNEDVIIAVDSVLGYIKEELCKKNRIEIRGFGTMSIRERKFAGQNKKYNTIYFRMSKNIQDILK